MSGEPGSGKGSDEALEGERDVAGEDPPSLTMPRWIPLLIGLVLVGIAALAVYTGLRFRPSPFTEATTPRRPTAALPEDEGAPGEPQPGASRILHGSSGENVPVPDTTGTQQHSRVLITGGRGGVKPSFHASVRRGLLLKIEPPDALVYINDQLIGTAQQFSTEEQAYEFADAGNFVVRLVATGYKDAVYQVSADPDAKDEMGIIEATLQKGH